MKKLLVLISSIFVITALAIAQQDTAPVSQDRIVSTFEKANQWLGKTISALQLHLSRHF